MNPDDPLGLLTPQKHDPSDPLGLISSGSKPANGKLAAAKRDAAMPHPEDQGPSYGEQVAGGIASLAHDIPGAEALQAMAGMRSLDLTKSSDRAQFGDAYRESLDQLHASENTANPLVRKANNLIGGTIAAVATPGKSVALQGARFGTAEALGGSEPNSLKERIDAVPAKAATNAAFGKVLGEMAPNAARVMMAKSLGKRALERTGAMEAADVANYGKAAAEGIGATDPAVTAALNHPTVKPYAAEIRNSPLFQGADDATVLREAYKLMTEKQQTLASRVINSSDYKAGSALEKNEITQGKRQLLNAADNVMPSFRPAVYGHATAKGELDAFRQAADATGRITRNASVAGKKLAQNSPESFMASILQMKQGEAHAAREGLLGRLKQRSGLTVNPLKGFGIPKSIHNVNQLAPYLDALDQQAGDHSGVLRRALGIAVGSDATQ